MRLWEKWEKHAELFLGLCILFATGVHVYTFVKDRQVPYKAALLNRNTVAVMDLIRTAHEACNEMAATIRLVQRAPSKVDPAGVESTWNHFANASSGIKLITAESVVQQNIELTAELLAIRKAFLDWKRSRVKESYDDADKHATALQDQCVAHIDHFIQIARADLDFERLSDDLWKRSLEELPQLYRGGGDGGGGGGQ